MQILESVAAGTFRFSATCTHLFARIFFISFLANIIAFLRSRCPSKSFGCTGSRIGTTNTSSVCTNPGRPAGRILHRLNCELQSVFAIHVGKIQACLLIDVPKVSVIPFPISTTLPKSVSRSRLCGPDSRTYHSGVVVLVSIKYSRESLVCCHPHIHKCLPEVRRLLASDEPRHAKLSVPVQDM